MLDVGEPSFYRGYVCGEQVAQAENRWHGHKSSDRIPGEEDGERHAFDSSEGKDDGSYSTQVAPDEDRSGSVVREQLAYPSPARSGDHPTEWKVKQQGVSVASGNREQNAIRADRSNVYGTQHEPQRLARPMSQYSSRQNHRVFRNRDAQPGYE